MGWALQFRIGGKPRDRHRRHGRQVVRIEHREQGIGELGKLIVEPVLHARAEEGHALEQAADMRIVDGVLGEAQAAGDLRMTLGELAGEHAQGFEFPVEVGEQGVRRHLCLLLENRHVLGEKVDDGVERDRLGRRLGMQQGVDAQPQRSAHLVGCLDQGDLEADDARLEAANTGLDERSQLFAAPRLVERAGGEIGQAESRQRAIELGEMRIPRAPSPAGVEKLLEVVADAEAHDVHCGPARQRAVRLLRGIGIDQPVEERKLGAPGPRRAETSGVFRLRLSLTTPPGR